jgi:DNA-binding response OmpR family regulator
VSARILLVEDEVAIRDVVAYALRAEGHEVVEQGDGDLALPLALREAFDVVVLDVMLPGLSGVEICRRIRASEERRDVPVVLLTARGGETDRVIGLDAGADDYVAKPFSTAELLARIRAILRRRELDRAGAARRRVGDLEFDAARHEAVVDGRAVSLTPSESRLLGVLAANADVPVSRDELVRALWGTDVAGAGRVCDTHVKNLRRKLERDPAEPKRLVTVRGVGYVLRTV